MGANVKKETFTVVYTVTTSTITVEYNAGGSSPTEEDDRNSFESSIEKEKQREEERLRQQERQREHERQRGSTTDMSTSNFE